MSKSLDSTFIYQNLNKNNALTKNITGLLLNGVKVKPEQIEEAIMLIRKNFKFAMKNTVMNMYDNGDIILMTSPSNIKLPTCLPFVLTKNKNGRVLAVIDVGIYGTVDKDTDVIRIDAKKLYCMMEGAAYARIYYENMTTIKGRGSIIINGSAIYSAMFTRVLNKKYALNLDKNKLQKVLLLSSKFFMINMLGMKDDETTYNYALKNCPNGNPITLEEVNNEFKTENFESIATFIDSFTNSEVNGGVYFKDLNTKSYLESFMNMYDPSTLLSLESFPYFIYNVCSVVNGGYINNQYILTDIVDTYGAKLCISVMDLGK